MTETTPVIGSVAGILNDGTALFGGIFDVIGDVITAVVSNPLLLIPVLIGFLGVGIGLFRKLRHG